MYGSLFKISQKRKQLRSLTLTHPMVVSFSTTLNLTALKAKGWQEQLALVIGWTTWIGMGFQGPFMVVK